MATEWISPTWRMPNDKNQSKFENYSLDFDAATDEYINCGTGVGDYFGNSYTGPLSISLWFKANATNSDDGLIWFSNNPTNSHGAFSFNISSNEIRVRNVATSKIAFTDTTSWHHLVAVMDASAATTGKIYLDGVLQSEYFTYSSINLLSNVLYIGTYYNVVGKTFDGNTSQVSIFDYALSQGQIDYLYNSGTPQNPMAISGQPPIAYWPLGGSSTGDAAAASPSTLTVPNESVPSATVFDFDGDPHIVCDSNFFTPSGTVGGAGNFMQVCSISWWMKSSRAGSYSVIFHLSGNGAWILRIDNVGNMWWFAGSGTNYVKFNNVTANSINLCDDEWHNCTFTIPDANDKDQCKFFIDNQEITSTTTSGAATGYGSLYIMSLLQIAGGYLGDIEGTEISNVQVWLDTALNDTDIATVYNNGVPLLSGTQPQAANLKAWYPMNVENANWLGSDWQIADATSAYPQSFDFGDRTQSEYIGLPQLPVFNAITISAWIKTQKNNATIQTIISNNQPNAVAAEKGWLIDIGAAWGSGYQKGRFVFFDSTGSTYTLIDQTSTQILVDNEWHHVVALWDGTTTANAVKIFVDGLLAGQGTSTFVGPINQPAATFEPRIGIGGYSASNGGGGNIFGGDSGEDGFISNVQTWDTALTYGSVSSIGDAATGQIAELYNNGSPLTTAIASSNLKGWYKLNNNEIWNGSKWEVENQAYPANWETALNFNASNISKLVLPSMVDLGSADWSFSFWFNTTQGSGPNNILGGGGIFTYLSGFSAGNGLYAYIGYVWTNLSGSVDINEGNWHHAVLTHNSDGDNTLKCYIDNVETYSNTYTPGALAGIIPAKLNNISTWGGGTTRPFNGNVSNLALWQGTTLSSSDVTTLYNNGTPEVNISFSPSNYWKLDNLTTGIQDSTGSGGTFTNTNTTKVNTFVSTEAATSSGMTESNLVNNNVSTLNGTSDGMITANLVNSDLTRSIPYSSYSMDFGGTDEYLDSSTAASGIQSATTGTISMWVQPTDATPSAIDTLISISDTSTANTYFNVGILTTGEVYAELRTSTFQWELSTDAAAFSDGTWGHLAITQNGTEPEIYINGIKVAQTFTTTTDKTKWWDDYTVNSINFARSLTQWGAANYYIGKISNIGIWTSALTQDQILTIFNGGVPNNISSLSPVNWWSLSGDSYYDGTDWKCPDLGSGNDIATTDNMESTDLIGNGPGSSANGTATNMDIPANLKGDAPNSSSNAFSVNMDSQDRVASVPS